MNTSLRVRRGITVTVGLLALGSAQLAVTGGTAHAAATTQVSVEQGVVRVVAPPGQRNSFALFENPGTAIVVRDVGNALTPVPPCRKVISDPSHPNQVSCPVGQDARVYVDAGDENDSVNAGGVPATILMGPGNDGVSGARGDLFIDLGPGDDVASPNAGDPEQGIGGPDVVIGGPGTDTISYGQHFVAVAVSLDDIADDGPLGDGDNIASDVENIEGSLSDDILVGNDANNRITGSFGADVIDGRGGDDLVMEGHFGPPYDRPDTIAGGTGVDTASYAGDSRPRTIRLDDVANDGEAGENDNVRSDVENVVGGDGNDTLVGSDASNTLRGGAGNDQLSGGNGDDLLIGDAGTDTGDGGNGTDTCQTEVRIGC